MRLLKSFGISLETSFSGSMVTRYPKDPIENNYKCWIRAGWQLGGGEHGHRQQCGDCGGAGEVGIKRIKSKGKNTIKKKNEKNL